MVMVEQQTRESQILCTPNHPSGLYHSLLCKIIHRLCEMFSWGGHSLCTKAHTNTFKQWANLHLYWHTSIHTVYVNTEPSTPTEALCDCGMKVMNSVYDSNTLSSLSNLSQILVTFSLRCPVSASLTGIVQN